MRIIGEILTDRAGYTAQNTECTTFVERVTRAGFNRTALKEQRDIVRITISFGIVQLLQLSKISSVQERLDRRQIDIECAGRWRRSEFLLNTVIDECDFSVSLVAIAEFVIGITTSKITLLRDLQIVHGSIVVCVTSALAEIARRIVKYNSIVRGEIGSGAIAVTEVTDNAVWKRRRTELQTVQTESLSTKREVRKRTVALEDRRTVEILTKDSRATAAIVKRGADRAMQLIAFTIAALGD